MRKPLSRLWLYSQYPYRVSILNTAFWYVHLVNSSTQRCDNDLATGAQNDLRLRVLRALEFSPELSQRELAGELGVALGGVNYAVKDFVEKGFVKVSNSRKLGTKAASLYVLTLEGVTEKASLASTVLDRKIEEREVLRQEIEALKGEVGLRGLGKGTAS